MWNKSKRIANGLGSLVPKKVSIQTIDTLQPLILTVHHYFNAFQINLFRIVSNNP